MPNLPKKLPLLIVFVALFSLLLAGCGDTKRICHTDRQVVSLSTSVSSVSIRVENDSNSYTLNVGDFSGEGDHTLVGDHVALCADVDPYGATNVVSFHNLRLEPTPTVVPAMPTPTISK